MKQIEMKKETRETRETRETEGKEGKEADGKAESEAESEAGGGETKDTGENGVKGGNGCGGGSGGVGGGDCGGGSGGGGGGGVVGLWCTNDPRLLQWARDTLLPSWGLAYVTTWYWIKVTNEGELICPLDSDHKKPYERLLVAVRKGKWGLQFTSILLFIYTAVCKI